MQEVVELIEPIFALRRFDPVFEGQAPTVSTVFEPNRLLVASFDVKALIGREMKRRRQDQQLTPRELTNDELKLAANYLLQFYEYQPAPTPPHCVRTDRELQAVEVRGCALKIELTVIDTGDPRTEGNRSPPASVVVMPRQFLQIGGRGRPERKPSADTIVEQAKKIDRL
jgi:hypothetical protein